MNKDQGYNEVGKLTIEEIVNRLCINDKEKIDHIYSLSLDLIKSEDKRNSEIDAKAANLSNFIGLFFTVIFLIFTDVLFQFNEIRYTIIIIIAFLISFTFAFCSYHKSLKALKVRNTFKTIDDEVIFDKKQIKEDLTVYKRYITAHFWRIYTNNYSCNEDKAAGLNVAFSSFKKAITSFFVLTLIVVACQLFNNYRKELNVNLENKPKPTQIPSEGKIKTLEKIAQVPPRPTPIPNDGKIQTKGGK